MRFFLLLVPFILSAQSPDAVSQALVSEIQQLRLAIERSTLISARAQLALGQLQMYETSLARLNTLYMDTRAGAANLEAQRLTREIQDLEEHKPSVTDPATRSQIDQQLRQMKIGLDEANARETARAAREGELANQLQAAQNQAADARGRIAELEKAIDYALQQMVKQK